MPAKKNNNILPKYVATVRNDGRVTGYKYQRRVPQKVRDMAAQLGATPPPLKYEIYLSADLTKAAAMAAEYAKLHDEEFAKAKTPRGMLGQRVEEKTAEIDQGKKDGTAVGGMWQDWQNVLARFGVDAPGFKDNAKADFLAACLASSFGERDLIEQIESPYARALAELEPDEVLPPTDPRQRVEFDAAKAMLLDQYAKLKPNRPAPVGERLSDRVTQYADFAALKKTTHDGMRTKVNRFIKHLGRDPALDQINGDDVKAYRDALDADPNMNRGSVNAYLGAVRTLYAWGVDEGHAKTDPTLNVRPLKDSRSVEDRKWKAFNDAEIKTVWRAVQDGWGPHGNTKLSADRKATFLMVFRVLLWTGMRPAEVFRLTPDDVFADRIEAKDTKTGPRTIALADAIETFPAFIQSAAWRNALRNEKTAMGDINGLQKTMSESFSKMIRAVGLTNEKHVLYSTKATLVRQLNRLEAPDNVQRSIIGHKTPGKLRHYTSPAELRDQLRYLNRIKYCAGLACDQT